MPKPSLPSNSIEIERKSGGTDGLSEKSRQIALVSDDWMAPPSQLCVGTPSTATASLDVLPLALIVPTMVQD